MRICFLFSLSLVFGLVSMFAAFADSITWSIEKNVPDNVQIIFYSQTRAGLHWPPSGAFDLTSNQQVPITLTCEPEEKICYGAWVAHNKQVSWGVGLGGGQGCPNCCSQCGLQKSVRLDPAAPARNANAVTAFKWIYNAQPSPGTRSWYLDTANHWHERYPDGSEPKIYTEVIRGSANGCSGAIAGGGDGDLQIFIPDTGCRQMTALFRRNDANWAELGRMFDIR